MAHRRKSWVDVVTDCVDDQEYTEEGIHELINQTNWQDESSVCDDFFDQIQLNWATQPSNVNEVKLLLSRGARNLTKLGHLKFVALSGYFQGVDQIK